MVIGRHSSDLAALVVLLTLFSQSLARKFVISNGQIFTPGFAIVDAPQPGTPLGGDFLQVALDVSADGRLPLRDSREDNNSPSQIFNITIFLYSYNTGRNFTITNGTAGRQDASLGNIMAQESGSTVKHVNWIWPDCLVGDGEPDDDHQDRGNYNISIRQSFRLNGDNHYTIFDLPIAVTNGISANDSRPPCDALDNKLLSPEAIDAESANGVGILFAPGDSTAVDVGDGGDGGDDGNDGNDNNGNGLGDPKPQAGPDDGLGDAAPTLVGSWRFQLGVLSASMLWNALQW